MLTRAEKTAAVKTALKFMGHQQLAALREGLRGEEKEWFEQKLFEIAETIRTMPKTYEQDGKGDEAIVYLHYFGRGRMNFYITEKDMCEEQEQAFGLSDLYGDGGELGYINIVELTENNVELDWHWKLKTIGEIKAKKERAA